MENIKYNNNKMWYRCNWLVNFIFADKLNNVSKYILKMTFKLATCKKFKLTNYFPNILLLCPMYM